MKKKRKKLDVSTIIQKETFEDFVKRQQTFTFVSERTAKIVSDKLWLPNELACREDATETTSGIISRVDTDSWFKISKIEKNVPKIVNPIFGEIFCHPCKIFNEINDCVDIAMENVTSNKEIYTENTMNEINKKIVKINDCREQQHRQFMDAKTQHKKVARKKKIIKLDTSKKACEFVVVTKFEGTKYGRICGGLCTPDNDKCKAHLNKKQTEYDMFTENVCQHIITQKSGGKNGNEVIDRKGMICNEFTFGSINRKYCMIHSMKYKSEDLVDKNTVERSFKVRIFPSKEQIKVLAKMFGDARKTYNLCVENESENVGMSEKDLKKIYVHREIEGLEYLRKTPEDVRAFSLGEWFTNCDNAKKQYEKKIENEEYKKANYEKYKPKDIPNSVMGFKKKKDSQSISIAKNALKIVDETENGIDTKKLKIYPRFFAKTFRLMGRSLKKDKKLKKIFESPINHAIKIIKTRTEKYYACFVTDNATIKSQKIGKVVAIDPNIRNLGTSYSENECYEFGTDISNQIKEMISKKEQLKKVRNDEHKTAIKTKIYETYKKSQQIYLRYEEKIRNRINDLHYKVISKLVSEKNTLILIPKLNIGKLLMDEEVHSTTKKTAQIESHSLFLKRLIEKAELKGVTVQIVNECMTTQSCGYCRATYKFKGETYICKECGLEIMRDVNSARNIYLKELLRKVELVIFLVQKYL